MSTDLAPPPAPPAIPPPDQRAVVEAIYSKLHAWSAAGMGAAANTLLLGAAELVALNAYVRATLPELNGTTLSEGDTFAGMNIKRALSGLNIAFVL